jgi:hypothetical protein
MPSIFPTIEGDDDSLLSRDFCGHILFKYYDELIALAEVAKVKSLNDFEYLDEEMMEEYGIELSEEQHEWHSTQDGIQALSAILSHPNLPDDSDLREELNELILILKSVPLSSAGWRLQQDI